MKTNDCKLELVIIYPVAFISDGFRKLKTCKGLCQLISDLNLKLAEEHGKATAHFDIDLLIRWES